MNNMKKADIKLGYSCNNECIHCVISDFRDEVIRRGLPEDISGEDYKQELQDSRKRADHIVFTGGEPTIRREILDLVAFARDLGFSISMQTNGRKLAHMDFAQALCAIAPIRFCIALHGPDEKTHDRITQRPGSFFDTVQGIRNVIEIQKTVELLSGKIVLSKVNAPCILETVRFMISLGFRVINITFPHACGSARKYFYEVVPRYREVVPGIIDSIELCRQQGVAVSTEALPFCLLPDLEYVATEIAEMERAYTELKQYGSEHKILDWNKVRSEIKSKFPQCRDCRFDSICEGIWMEYPQYYDHSEIIAVAGDAVAHTDQIRTREYLSFRNNKSNFYFAPDTMNIC